MPRKRILRFAVQTLVLLIVAWGIVHSGRKAASQLALQRTELANQASLTEQAALVAAVPHERQELLREAARLRNSVDRFWQASPMLLAAAGVCYAIGMLPANWYWRQCLLTMDQRAPLMATSWSYFYGNLGKYFPGKAMVIVLRLGALKEYDFKKMATAITIFMETLTMMAVGGALSALCLIVLNLDWKLTLLAFGLLVCMFVPTLPSVLRIIIAKLQKGVSAATLREWTSRIHARLVLKGWAAMTVTWLLFGLSLLCILRGLPIAETVETEWVKLLLSSLGACALAVVLGFVSLLPGGAGVREVVLSTILAPVVGPTAALCAAIWLRVTWLATELAVVAILAAVRFLQRRYRPASRVAA
jgi:uncharacterized membrane protein YbhN (UPF0104 family)